MKTAKTKKANRSLEDYAREFVTIRIVSTQRHVDIGRKAMGLNSEKVPPAFVVSIGQGERKLDIGPHYTSQSQANQFCDTVVGIFSDAIESALEDNGINESF